MASAKLFNEKLIDFINERGLEYDFIEWMGWNGGYTLLSILFTNELDKVYASLNNTQKADFIKQTRLNLYSLIASLSGSNSKVANNFSEIRVQAMAKWLARLQTK